ncbi:hypothetical protein HY449_04160 [Candidatus Pacearchaeota archaeon]|nr:hypothetical protein [Candidatus Pacearchaeota archaeon]
MKKSVSLFLVSLLFVFVLFVSLISASILGSWFDESTSKITGQAANSDSENTNSSQNSNIITGWLSWSWSRSRQRAYCGDGKINVAGEQCDRTNLGGKICQTQGFGGGDLRCDLNNCRFVTSGCTASTETIQKTCEQTRTLTRQTNPNLCTSEETRGQVTTSSECTRRNWYKGCAQRRTFYSYICTGTTQTACSADAACPTGTREIGSTSCQTSPASGNNWNLIGPSDGRVNSIVLTQDNKLYAATSSGGVFRSLDKGQTWTSFSYGLNSTNTFLIKIIKDKLYVTAGDSVYVLENDKWKNLLREDGSTFNSINYDDKTNRLWASSLSGVHYSNDLGISWNSVNVRTDEDSFPYSSLFVSKNNEIYVSTSIDIYKNLGNAVNEWSKVLNGVGIMPNLIPQSFTEDDKGNIYVSDTIDNNIYVKKPDANIFEINGLPNKGDLLFYFNKMFLHQARVVTGEGTLVISDEMGNILSQIQSSTITQTMGNGFWDIRQLYPLVNENKILIAHDNGISELDLSTKTIRKLPSIPKYSEVGSFALSGKNSLVTSYWDHASLITDNNGLNWRQGPDYESNYLFGDNKIDTYLAKEGNTISLRNVTNLVPLWGIDCALSQYPPYAQSIALDTSKNIVRVYALCRENGQGKLVSFDITNSYFSSNLLKTNLPDSYAVTIDPNNSFRLIIVSGEGVYESLDKGQTWSQLINRPQGGLWGSISINPFDSSEILVGGFNGNIFSIKSGQINEILVSSISSQSKGFANYLAYDDKKPNVIYVGFSNGFYYSKDDGKTWQEFNNGLYSKDIRKIIPKDDKIYIGTWGSGIAVIQKSSLGL